jgi:hypothetical protein
MNDPRPPQIARSSIGDFVSGCDLRDGRRQRHRQRQRSAIPSVDRQAGRPALLVERMRRPQQPGLFLGIEVLDLLMRSAQPFDEPGGEFGFARLRRDGGECREIAGRRRVENDRPPPWVKPGISIEIEIGGGSTARMQAAGSACGGRATARLRPGSTSMRSTSSSTPRRPGYAVPDGALQRGHARIKEFMRELPQANMGAYAQGAEATRAYAAFVLARAGRADPGEQ